ncbi:Crp/Fnr family transcriptional regulator [uncultured Rikenella sp.]|uniref:Crp/Fnr family transcriptional regulator n=1 Tax=uncultured Rikenella sp. TaxID=368003 RepID=UPI00262DD27C|nr:Crp/Fnr family transcriptional regulator [uncultured Rikenella sp.]
MFPILKDSPLFRGLDQQTIDKLLEHASYATATYGRDDCIARRDTAYSGLMIILKGSVRGEMTDAAGRRRMIDNIAAPQLIAPAFLFGGYNRLPIDVVANEDGTEIMTLHRGGLFEMMQDNTIILSNFIDIISNRANYFSRKIYALSVLMLTEKVAALLLSSAAAQEDTVPLEIEKMADELDITRNAFEQTLSELAKKGYVELSATQIVIRDRRALEAMVAPQ